MKKNARIFVAGCQGLVGSAIVRRLRAEGYINLLTPPREELDLIEQAALMYYFKWEKPEYVFLAAAKVGGILANNTYPADFIFSNMTIQNNVIHQAYLSGVKRLLFLGSSCIYPKFAPQPMQEEHLLTGPLEPTNEPYAVAKIAGIKTCEAYNRQYGTRFIAAMPTNLYGPNDNFDLEGGHVLPAFLRRFHEAKHAGHDEVVVWGTGSPRREFLHVDDMAEACVFIMNLSEDAVATEFTAYPKPCFANIGTGEDMTIRELAELIAKVVGYPGKLVFDPTKPDGTPRKLLDVSRLRSLGWQAQTPLRDGVEKTYRWFLDHLETFRK
jgi:GDP-L-fucose synthase